MQTRAPGLSVLHHGSSRWGKKGFYATTARINFQRGGFFLTNVLASAPSFRASRSRDRFESFPSLPSEGMKNSLAKKRRRRRIWCVSDGKSEPRRRKPRGERDFWTTNASAGGERGTRRKTVPSLARKLGLLLNSI